MQKKQCNSKQRKNQLLNEQQKPFSSFDFPPSSHAPNILTTKIYCIIFGNIIICNMYNVFIDAFLSVLLKQLEFVLWLFAKDHTLQF